MIIQKTMPVRLKKYLTEILINVTVTATFIKKADMKTDRHIICNSDIKRWWWQANSDGHAGAKVFV